MHEIHACSSAQGHLPVFTDLPEMGCRGDHMKKLRNAFLVSVLALTLTACQTSGTASADSSTSAGDSGSSEPAETESNDTASEPSKQESHNVYAWTRTGSFIDDNNNFATIADVRELGDETLTQDGYYVGCLLDNWPYSAVFECDGETLSGIFQTFNENPDFGVTIIEDGEKGIAVITDDGKEYHLVPDH